MHFVWGVNHLIANLSTPEWFVLKVKDLILKFLWDDNPPKIKNNVITNTIEKGGVQFPNIELIVRSQKVAWIKRMLENREAAWMQLFYSILPHMKIHHLLKCSIDPLLLSDDIPLFYRQVLYAWYELNTTPLTGLDIRREIIWLNKYIKIDNMSVFNTNLYQNGVCSIKDLLNEEGLFMNYDDFINKYNIQINKLYYMGLVDAIPNKCKRLLRTCKFPLNITDNDEDPHIKINDQDKNITQTKSKEIYHSLLKRIESTPNCIEAWNKRLPHTLTPEDWAYIFTLPKATVCDTKIIAMQYKILHRVYATNSIISKWDSSKGETCPSCKQKANIIHNFFSCTEVQTFWLHLERNFARYNIPCPSKLTLENIILGLFKQVRYDMLNHVVMYAKYYIHKQFVANNKLNAEAFWNSYKQTLCIERMRYIEKNQLQVFNNLFGKSNLLREINFD